MDLKEVERRFAEIDAREPEDASPEDLAAIAAAADDDTMTLEEFKESLKEYSGRMVLRIPRSLHRALKEEAAAEGVSLNTLMLYKLAK